MKDRANTDLEKKQIVDRLLAVWKKHPELRLGQLLQIVFEEKQVNIRQLPMKGKPTEEIFHVMEIFYREDFPLIETIEGYFGKKLDKETN